MLVDGKIWYPENMAILDSDCPEGVIYLLSLLRRTLKAEREKEREKMSGIERAGHGYEGDTCGKGIDLTTKELRALRSDMGQPDNKLSDRGMYSAFDKLNGIRSELSGRIEILEKSLKPILLPEEPTPDQSQNIKNQKEPVPIRCPFADMIENESADLRRIVSHVNSLIARINI